MVSNQYLLSMATIQRHLFHVFRPCSRQLVTRGATSYTGGISKLGQPIRAILSDYVDVFSELFISCKKRPIKTLVYLSLGGMIMTGFIKRPDRTSYVNDVLEYSNELSMCSEIVRSPKAKQYIDTLITMETDGYLGYINLGIAALIIRKSHSTYCSNYHDTCSMLQPRFWHMHEMVVDVGVWSRWLLLETEMNEYDVNDDELEKTLHQH